MWNYTFPNFNMNYSFTSPMFSGFVGSSSGNSSTTYENYLNEIEKEKKAQREERAKLDKNLLFNQEKNAQISELQGQINEIDTNINKIKDNTDKNGNYVEIQDNKKQDTTSKIFRWLGNAWEGTKNIGKSMAGIEKDGSWNWKKCLANTGIAVTAVGACFIPVVGPYIGVVLATAGVTTSGYGVYKGVKKLNEAEKSGDEKKIDEAQQDITSNAIVGVLSLVGLKGACKAFKAPPTSPAVASTPTTGAGTGTSAAGATAGARTGASAAGATSGARSGFMSKITDVITRPAKADLAKVRTDGFWSTYANNFKQLVPRPLQEKYSQQYTNMETKLTNKISELDNQILTETNPVKLQLLKEERQFVNNNLLELRSLEPSINPETNYTAFKNDNSVSLNREYFGLYERTSTGGYRVEGIDVSAAEFKAFQKTFEASQKSYLKDLQNLIGYTQKSTTAAKTALTGAAVVPALKAQFIDDKFYSLPIVHSVKNQNDISDYISQQETLKLNIQTLIDKIKNCKTPEEYNTLMMALEAERKKLEEASKAESEQGTKEAADSKSETQSETKSESKAESAAA